MSFTQRIFDFFSRKSTKAKGGGDKAISKQKAGGKMTARERIAALLDEGSFNEYDMFVEHKCQDFGMGDLSMRRVAAVLALWLGCASVQAQPAPLQLQAQQPAAGLWQALQMLPDPEQRYTAQDLLQGGPGAGVDKLWQEGQEEDGPRTLPEH